MSLLIFSNYYFVFQNVFKMFQMTCMFGLVNYFSIGIMKTYIKNNTSSINKYSEKFTSTVHTMASIYFALNVIVNSNSWENRAFYIDNYSVSLSYVSCGYFLYDILMILFTWQHENFNVKRTFLIHGVSCLLINLFPLIYKFGHFYNAVFIMWELSTPFLNMRWFLKDLYNKDNIIIDLLFVFTFFTSRIVWGTFFSCLLLSDIYNDKWMMIQSNRSVFPYIGASCAIIMMNYLNYYWFLLIFRKYFSKFIKL
jgi:hypothetical protein